MQRDVAAAPDGAVLRCEGLLGSPDGDDGLELGKIGGNLEELLHLLEVLHASDDGAAVEGLELDLLGRVGRVDTGGDASGEDAPISAMIHSGELKP